MKKIFKAMAFALKAHEGQFRKGTKIPYFIHPLHVANTLIEYDCAEYIVIAGLLHDTVEDTRISVKDIERNFGKKIAGLVQGVTEPEKTSPWEIRKRHTIDSIKHAPADMLLIQCADKLDNLKSIAEDFERLGDAVWQRFNRPFEQQKWYFQSIAKELLKRKVDEPAAVLVQQLKHLVEEIFNEKLKWD